MLEFNYQKVGLDDSRLTDLYRLRYQVYCDECGFEKPEDHPNGLETDEFDEVSSHFCAFNRDTREIIGTARIILPSEKAFPIEKHFSIDRKTVAAIDHNKIGEISRLAISKDFRRRVIDNAIYAENQVDANDRSRYYCPRPVERCPQCVAPLPRGAGLPAGVADRQARFPGSESESGLALRSRCWRKPPPGTRGMGQ